MNWKQRRRMYAETRIMQLSTDIRGYQRVLDVSIQERRLWEAELNDQALACEAEDRPQ